MCGQAILGQVATCPYWAIWGILGAIRELFVLIELAFLWGNL